MQSPREITLIGAGIVGMVSALTLQRDGHRVTVIDSNPPGKGCSFGHAGAISPGSCIPMAMPGMLAKVPGWLFDPLSPLAVRWRYLPTAFPWLLRWTAAGRLARVREYAGALSALLSPSLDLYRGLLGDAGVDDLFRIHGQLYLWAGETADPKEALAQSLRDTHGVRTEPVDAEGIRRMAPDLAPLYKRGLLFPDNGHTVNPLRVVETVAEAFRREGGTIRQARVRDFDMGADGPRAVHTDTGDLPVDTLVISAGAWSHRLAAKLGTSVPLEAERGYHVMLPDPGVALDVQLMNREDMIGVTPLETGLRIAGTVEIAGVDAPPDYRRAEVLLNHARRMFPGLNDEGAEMWMGCRPSFPDSLPVIDRSPHHASVFYAFGNGHTGLTGAPMTGRLLADKVNGREPSIDPRPFAVNRF